MYWESGTDFGIVISESDKFNMKWAPDFSIDEYKRPEVRAFVECIADRINGIGEPAAARIVLGPPRPRVAWKIAKVYSVVIAAIVLAYFIGRGGV